MTPKFMDLSIIIVSWNTREALKNNLTQLLKSQGLSFEVFVVDNNSSDGTVEVLKAEFPQLNIIANSANHGFAKANNQALALAGGDFILLLNPDMLVDDQTTLAKALAWLKSNPQAWVAGFKLLDSTGQILPQVRRFPTLADQLAIILKLPHLFPSLLNRYIVKDFDYEQASAVDSIRGSFFFIRRETLQKVGRLDERFFVWFEEVDYCRRVYQAGAEVWYAPVASATDLVGQSFGLLPRPQAQRYFRASQLSYFQKWHPTWQGLILQVAWLFSSLAMTIFNLIKRKN